MSKTAKVKQSRELWGIRYNQSYKIWDPPKYKNHNKYPFGDFSKYGDAWENTTRKGYQLITQPTRDVAGYLGIIDVNELERWGPKVNIQQDKLMALLDKPVSIVSKEIYTNSEGVNIVEEKRKTTTLKESFQKIVRGIGGGVGPGSYNNLLNLLNNEVSNIRNIVNNSSNRIDLLIPIEAILRQMMDAGNQIRRAMGLVVPAPPPGILPPGPPGPRPPGPPGGPPGRPRRWLPHNLPPPPPKPKKHPQWIIPPKGVSPSVTPPNLFGSPSPSVLSDKSTIWVPPPDYKPKSPSPHGASPGIDIDESKDIIEGTPTPIGPSPSKHNANKQMAYLDDLIKKLQDRYDDYLKKKVLLESQLSQLNGLLEMTGSSLSNNEQERHLKEKQAIEDQLFYTNSQVYNIHENIKNLNGQREEIINSGMGINDLQWHQLQTYSEPQVGQLTQYSADIDNLNNDIKTKLDILQTLLNKLIQPSISTSAIPVIPNIAQPSPVPTEPDIDIDISQAQQQLPPPVDEEKKVEVPKASKPEPEPAKYISVADTIKYDAKFKDLKVGLGGLIYWDDIPGKNEVEKEEVLVYLYKLCKSSANNKTNIATFPKVFSNFLAKMDSQDYAVQIVGRTGNAKFVKFPKQF